MIRNCSLDEISDGKQYTENDLVKTDTNNCSGCQAVCCHGMGKSIVLDPYDAYCLTKKLGCTFEQLLVGQVELNVVDGLILPNLKMMDQTESCAFLEVDHRCKVHDARPGICRLFPLGRYWQDEEHFSYILQTDQCYKDNLSKIKVKKWLGIDHLSEYNQFVTNWHKYRKRMQNQVASLRESEVQEDQQQIKEICMKILQVFYLIPYQSESDFYTQFAQRMSQILA